MTTSDSAAAADGEDAAGRPVARLGGPAELAAALPLLCGFVPSESLVVVALHGPRHRVGLTMRLDLPPRAHEEAVAADLLERVQRTGADEALVLVCTEASDADDLPRAGLVRRVRRRLRSGGVRCDDALLVRAGRWASYVCRDERCCPPAGTPLAAPGSTPALSLVEADAVGRGVSVLPSREALVASLHAPPPEREVLRLIEQAAERRWRLRRTRGGSAVGADDLVAWRRAVAGAPRRDVPDAERASLVVSLDDLAVRDAVLTSHVDDGEPLLAVLLQLARWAPSPHDAQVCAVLAWTAHLAGNGGLAAVALDRALTSEPRCGLALLGRQALDVQLAPAELRAVLADTARLLHRTHPWTAP